MDKAIPTFNVGEKKKENAAQMRRAADERREDVDNRHTMPEIKTTKKNEQEGGKSEEV